MKASILIATAFFFGLINAQSIQAQSGQELFQQALVMEFSDGQSGVTRAIPLYQRIVMEFVSDRALVAKALIRIGLAQEALGSTEAKRAYQRIVSYYTDQPEQMIVAQSRLAALTSETVGRGNGEVQRVLQPGAPCSDQSDDAIATFEDANLELRVRSSLLISAQEGLTCGLVSGLTSLDAVGAEIESLLGIQNLTSLTRLVLGSNSITDISALSALARLTNLQLYSNSITDISALSGFTSLTRLNLSRNSITDISALRRLTSLTDLRFRSNQVTDISALSGLTGLTFIHFGYNTITDLSALSELASLTRLRAMDNAITDISALSGLANLTELNLNRNPDLSNIQSLLDNTGLGVGDFVGLWGTNASCADVAALRAEVRVSSDCPVSRE